jgi:hypothetical protein
LPARLRLYGGAGLLHQPSPARRRHRPAALDHPR